MVEQPAEHPPESPPEEEREAPPLAQCRFCLEEAPQEELLTPCKCTGSSRFVHAECLRRWQEEVVGATAAASLEPRGRGTVVKDERASICQACRSPFSQLPPQAPPVRSARPRTRTGTRAATPPSRDLHTRLAVAMWEEPQMEPIFRHITTNPYFDRSAVSSLPSMLYRRLLRCIGAGCLVLREPAAVRPTIRSEHWNHGVFLIGGIWPGQGHANSDALIGVNLVGTLQTGFLPGGLPPGLADLEAFLSDGATNRSGGGRPSAAGRLRVLNGGPVGPRRLLALVSFEGTPPPEVPLVKLLLPARAEDSSDEGGRNSEPGETLAPACCDGALFGEPADVLALLRNAAPASLRPVSAVAFQGHAVWSSMQLLSEVSRGNWGLTRARAEDFLLSATTTEERIVSWQRLWEARRPVGVSAQRACTYRRRTGCSGACVTS